MAVMVEQNILSEISDTDAHPGCDQPGNQKVKAHVHSTSSGSNPTLPLRWRDHQPRAMGQGKSGGADSNGKRSKGLIGAQLSRGSMPIETTHTSTLEEQVKQQGMQLTQLQHSLQQLKQT
eukprot:2559469-Amphidinium_carterae.1